jgi:hypothetical protein
MKWKIDISEMFIFSLIEKAKLLLLLALGLMFLNVLIFQWNYKEDNVLC